mmetsp:Transcript_2215/g.3956  ORF Transcript_2215/g.3956 Transcript_2215/m.3956 type:complete len:330 (-) Transcript_2215:13-1002(-)
MVCVASVATLRPRFFTMSSLRRVTVSSRWRPWQNWQAHRRALQYRKEVVAVATLEPEMKSLSDDGLAAITEEIQTIACADRDRTIVLRALAAGREAAFRAVSQRAYDTQILAALVLYDGRIAEMGTGEGKTLAILLAAYAHAVQSRDTHIVLPNSYLCERDHAQASAILARLNVEVGLNAPGARPLAKRQSYAKPVVYSVFNDLAHDYLRDSLATNLSDQVQRDLSCVILDEIDSILIDNARTPVVLSNLSKPPKQLLTTVARLVRDLDSGLIDVNLEMQSASLTEDGIDQIEAGLVSEGLLEEGQSLFSAEAMSIVHRVFQALRARVI